MISIITNGSILALETLPGEKIMSIQGSRGLCGREGFREGCEGRLRGK